MKLIEDWLKYEGFQDICRFGILNPDTEEGIENEDCSTKNGIFDDEGNPLMLPNTPIPDLCKNISLIFGKMISYAL